MDVAVGVSRGAGESRGSAAAYEQRRSVRRRRRRRRRPRLPEPAQLHQLTGQVGSSAPSVHSGNLVVVVTRADPEAEDQPPPGKSVY